MNQEIRKFLIDKCVIEKPVFYEDVAKLLNLDLSSFLDRERLSITLGEISEFEYKNKRPLLSSMAIYKQTGDHGNGFYNICEDLGIGKASELKKNFFAVTQMNECIEFWQKKEKYQKFAEIEKFESLRLKEQPKSGYSKLPELNPKFQEVKKDYVEEEINNKKIGDAGEDLVKKYERHQLQAASHADWAEDVKIVKDGEGYDILSFDENGDFKYIEVKTTPKGASTAFYYTINELLFAKQNQDNYQIYRLFNFDEEKNSADFFIISNVEESVLLQDILYKAYLKQQ